MIRTAIIIGSTRPNRVGDQVARWVQSIADGRDDASYELIDLRDFDLPLLDEPIPPSQGQYSKTHTKVWAETIAPFDAFVFVTPEYNHGICGALKNAIDYLYAEWNNKAAGFVSYGSAGGVRAVECLRLVMGEIQVADVRNQVQLSLFEDFEAYKTFKPHPRHEKSLHAMLDQLTTWALAMRGIREQQGKAVTQRAAPSREPARERPQAEPDAGVAAPI